MNENYGNICYSTSMIPIWEPRPRERSMQKKRQDQMGAPGIFKCQFRLDNIKHPLLQTTQSWVLVMFNTLVKTSAMTMKASPVPCAASSSSASKEQFFSPMCAWFLMMAFSWFQICVKLFVKSMNMVRKGKKAVKWFFLPNFNSTEFLKVKIRE